MLARNVSSSSSSLPPIHNKKPYTLGEMKLRPSGIRESESFSMVSVSFGGIYSALKKKIWAQVVRLNQSRKFGLQR